MSNNQGTATVENWAARVRDLHKITADPITSTDDPRWTSTLDEFNGRFDVELAEYYGGRHFMVRLTETLLSSAPVEVPAWSSKRTVMIDEWPVVTIVDESAPIYAGRASAFLSQEVEIVVDDLPDDWNMNPFGEPLRDVDDRPMGTITARPVSVEFRVEAQPNVHDERLDDWLPTADARALAEVLSAALAVEQDSRTA